MEKKTKGKKKKTNGNTLITQINTHKAELVY